MSAVEADRWELFRSTVAVSLTWEGLPPRNARLAQTTVRDVLRQGRPLVAAADSNAEPHVFREGFAPYKWNGQ
eukprot:8638642-Pyramimonas_sp.AAC.1